MAINQFYISGSCLGEECTVCGGKAAHKVGEEFADDDPRIETHNLTAYICCECFQIIFGPFAKNVCKTNRHELILKK